MSYRFTFTLPPPDGGVWGREAAKTLIGQELEVGTVGGVIEGQVVTAVYVDPNAVRVTIEHEGPDDLSW